MNCHRIAENFETFLRKKEFLKKPFKKKWSTTNSLEWQASGELVITCLDLLLLSLYAVS